MTASQVAGLLIRPARCSANLSAPASSGKPATGECCIRRPLLIGTLTEVCRPSTGVGYAWHRCEVCDLPSFDLLDAFGWLTVEVQYLGNLYEGLLCSWSGRADVTGLRHDDRPASAWAWSERVPVFGTVLTSDGIFALWRRP
jgi:hypothetical protein